MPHSSLASILVVREFTYKSPFRLRITLTPRLSFPRQVLQPLGYYVKGGTINVSLLPPLPTCFGVKGTAGATLCAGHNAIIMNDVWFEGT